MQSIISNELNFFPQSLVCICIKLDLSFLLTGSVLFLNSFGLLFFCRCWMIQVKTICTWVSLSRYSSSWQMLHTYTCTFYSTFRCLMYVKPENVLHNTLTLFLCAFTVFELVKRGWVSTLFLIVVPAHAVLVSLCERNCVSFPMCLQSSDGGSCW